MAEAVWVPAWLSLGEVRATECMRQKSCCCQEQASLWDTHRWQKEAKVHEATATVGQEGRSC